MLKFIENTQYKGMKTRIEEDLVLKCALSNDELKVKIVISYKCRKQQLELVSFRDFLSKFESETIESLCYKIYYQLKNHVKNLQVCITGKTDKHPICQIELS